MLSGNKPLSIKEVAYQTELAYGQPYLSYQEFNNIINESVDFIKKWMPQNGYDIHNNEAVHKAIQKFIGEKLTIQIPSIENKNLSINKGHEPFIYDFIDYKGEKDFRNYFVTKAFATGTGQCNSLPIVYLILAEALNVEAFLSYAPHMYPDNSGTVHSYEPTSHWNISNKWYTEYLFVRSEAKRSGIYLNPLNKQQIIASAMLDLAFGYKRKYGVADGKFINTCIQNAISFFPNESNIQAHFLHSNVLAVKIDRLLQEYKINNIYQAYQIPEIKKLLDALQLNEDKIIQLGYQDMPQGAYEKMMEEYRVKGNIQAKNNTNTKTKKNLFYTF